MSESSTSVGSFESLIRRVYARDESAAAELVRRFEPELRRVIRFHLSDPGMRRLFESLDICQSVLGAFFAQLYAGELSIVQPRQVGALLAMMARHKVIDRARQFRSVRHGGGKVQSLGDDAAMAAKNVPQPEELAADRDLLQAVRHRLPDLERRALDLWLEGHEWGAIAGNIGGTSEALRKRIGRAVDNIARQLGIIEDSE